MSTQAMPRTELESELSGKGDSGSLEAERPSDLARAHKLAMDIEHLLAPAPDANEAYGRRLARALARSLIDQLADLSRDLKRSKPV